MAHFVKLHRIYPDRIEPVLFNLDVIVEIDSLDGYSIIQTRWSIGIKVKETLEEISAMSNNTMPSKSVIHG